MYYAYLPAQNMDTLFFIGCVGVCCNAMYNPYLRKGAGIACILLISFSWENRVLAVDFVLCVRDYKLAPPWWGKVTSITFK